MVSENILNSCKDHKELSEYKKFIQGKYECLKDSSENDTMESI